MLKTYSQQQIRFATVEKPTAWVVVAILVETRGDETVAVSEPRIVRIIPKTKAELALPGSTVQKAAIFALPAPITAELFYIKAIVSPFASSFSFSTAGVIPTVSARPPTN